ncbi:rod shape-determining protein MreC [Guyparkeria sp.]|uniref:rod shape-determining protein MreC n=1 Tax=Guyparkeria sp. TaxID=2035736 RepID=UPI0035646EAB
MALFDTHRPGFNLLLVLVVVSIVLMSLDRIGTRWVNELDGGVGGATDAVIKVIHQPVALFQSVVQWFGDRDQLHDELERLQEENLLLRGQMQQFASLKREVDGLRQLLNGRPVEVPPVLLARRIGRPPNAEGNLFTIGRGLDDDVLPGDPVIDAYGLVGQVLRSTRSGATVIQLTSRDHVLSVLLGETGRSALMRGTGGRELVVERVPERTRVAAGDLLYTSGVDGAFPRGYPAARVTRVDMDEAQGFVRLHAEPTADLDRLDHVLVITEPPDSPTRPAAAEDDESVDMPPVEENQNVD